MNWFLWSSLIALLLLGVEGASTRVDNKLSSDEKRQSRQAVYRGSTKFVVPEYLRPDAYARTLYSNDQRDSDGSFNYEYQTDNGISVKQESTGYGANKVVRGYYSYIGADGKQYTVNYIADRFGYRAYGDHLPTQPNVIYTPSFPENQEQYQQFIQQPKPAPTDFYGHQYQQHHTQTAFIPADTLQSQHIYVTEQAPSNFINITPKPIALPQPIAVTIRPPAYGNYVLKNQPIAWTTQRPYVSF